MAQDKTQQENFYAGEHLFKAWESWEYFQDLKTKESLHANLKDGEMIVFDSLIDFISYCFLGNGKIKRLYFDEFEFEEAVQKLGYNFFKIKKDYPDNFADS